MATKPHAVSVKPRRAGAIRAGAIRLDSLLPEAVAPVLHQRGLASSAILTGWAEIAGPHLAGWTTPLEIRWPRRPEDREAAEKRRAAQPARGKAARSEHAVLVIGVAGAFALEAQMAERAIVEAVNRRLGYAAIGGIEIRQAPHRPAVAPAPPRVLPPETVARVEAGLGDIADDGLRRALARLGAAIERDRG
ncbi:DUF721 domain-containing protein [Rhabdaerophilum calidifontis]|uniref:DUF721 domain-containing protein n=1 Tax=Rhabdaerophilum calidifontis TaxID=2604328 RepID=UPI001407D6FF|nr:DciA family protein [Rhabdaerophilum calidifontis]